MPPPPPPPAPPAAPPAGFTPPPPAAPPAPPAFAPPAVGSWGTGRPYDPAAARPAVLRGLTGADWRPAFKVMIAPTAVLFLAALIAAVPDDYTFFYLFRAPSFGERFGGALALALAALGAPFELGFTGGGRYGDGGGEALVRAVPMTVTALWLLALWIGLRTAARRRQAGTGEQWTSRQAAAEALRTAVAAAAVTLLIGLLAGADWHPGTSDGRFDVDHYAGSLGGVTYSADSGWLQAVGWTALLAGLVAFAVHGTDALRWAAWRNRAVRGWAVAALAAGRALTMTIGLASLVGFVLIAVQGEGGEAGASLAVLPNVGLLLLGLGSAATLEVGSGGSPSTADPDGESGSRDNGEFSFFDLHGESADWRWTGLLALAAVAFLGWTAYRRRLDTADRLRLAVVYAAGLSLLMAIAGAVVSTSSTTTYSGRQREFGAEYAVGLAFATVLAVNVIWAAVGALAVPPLLAATGGGRVQAVPGAAPQDAPYQGAPAPARTPQEAVIAPEADLRPGVSEVIGSHEEPPATPSGGVPPARSPGEDEPVDPSVWRKQQ
ncbi:hypothetical protein [Kitasatospora sp. NPDC005748]|uniref:hypothetical protein n=1 Tax=Kitasatospora sp. NPDC005748 TaxID=3157063 RepID=UPI003407031F